MYNLTIYNLSCLSFFTLHSSFFISHFSLQFTYFLAKIHLFHEVGK